MTNSEQTDYKDISLHEWETIMAQKHEKRSAEMEQLFLQGDRATLEQITTYFKQKAKKLKRNPRQCHRSIEWASERWGYTTLDEISMFFQKEQLYYRYCKRMIKRGAILMHQLDQHADHRLELEQLAV